MWHHIRNKGGGQYITSYVPFCFLVLVAVASITVAV